MRLIKRSMIIFVLGGIIVLFLLLRLRGSVTLKPSKFSLPAKEVTAYRQDDAAWADDLLGTSAYTMKSSGCLVSCIASAVSMETGTAVTPGSLNAIFQRRESMTAREIFSGRRLMRSKDLQPRCIRRYHNLILTPALPRDSIRLSVCGCMGLAASTMCWWWASGMGCISAWIRWKTA